MYISLGLRDSLLDFIVSEKFPGPLVLSQSEGTALCLFNGKMCNNTAFSIYRRFLYSFTSSCGQRIILLVQERNMQSRFKLSESELFPSIFSVK